MKKILLFFISIVSLLFAVDASAAVTIKKVAGWFESGYVTWEPVAGATSYNVYYKASGAAGYTKLDDPLVREYPTYGRADIVGIKAGNYQFKVVPVDANGEMTAEATETSTFTAAAYDRGGFAHFKTASSTFKPANGIGAYKNDGTLKDGAKVIYVYADNAKEISTEVKIGSKATNVATYTGFQAIIDAYQKGYDQTPIDFRIIGTIKAADMDGFSSSAEGLQIKGNKPYSELNITIEGIGSDAVIHGFGFLIRNACSVELRNFAVMWCMDDAVSMDTDNSNLWVHNLDLFYGKPGGAADQKKGDGTLDIKGDSKYSTLSYNHLWDSGKSSLCGMTSESGPNYLTYHHNWFDHSDSRHPRIRTMSVHVYNNYYDGNSKYGVGAAQSSNVFVENNYFRNCKYPMLISKQGSDVHNGVGSSADTKGTFSGEAGGMIKALGNYMVGEKSFEPYVAGHATYATHFDAYVVESRDEKVPAEVSALLGGRKYDNFDTDADLMYTGYTCHPASEVKDVVTGELGAGRCEHGDFSWTFGESEDANDQVIAALSTAVQNYKSTLKGFYGKAVSNGGANEGDNSGSSNEGTQGGDDTPGDDSGDDNTIVEESYISGETIDDYFFFSPENKEKADQYIADGIITLGDGKVAGAETSSFNPEYTNVTYKKDSNGNTTTEVSFETIYTGALSLAKASSAGNSDGGSVVFLCKKGITSFAAYMYRTGSVYFKVYASTDNVNWKEVTKVDKGSAGIYEKNLSSVLKDTEHRVYVKIQNTSTGSLNIQGIRILNEKDATEKEDMETWTPSTDGGDTGNSGTGDVDANAFFKFTVKELVTGATKEDGTVLDKTNPITTQGGTVVIGKASGVAAQTVSPTGFAMKLDGDASAKNSKYVLVNLDSPLKTGDKISIDYFASGGATGYGVSIYPDMTQSPVKTFTNTAKNTMMKGEMTVGSELDGASSFYICRVTGKSAFFTGITITRPGDTTAVESTESVVKTDNVKHNIMGIKVAKPQSKSLYIMNGKKYVAK